MDQELVEISTVITYLHMLIFTYCIVLVHTKTYLTSTQVFWVRLMTKQRQNEKKEKACFILLEHESEVNIEDTIFIG